MKKTQKGFTLIELLIVIAIIGILASVVLVSLSSARDKAKTAAFKSQVTSLQASAVVQCDSLAVASNNVAGLKAAIGTPPTGASFPGGAGEAVSCSSVGAGTFTLNVASTGLATNCTAIIKDTGVFSWGTCQ